MVPSPNSYTQSTAAMALLQPTVSWAQVRADRDRQLQFQAAIAQDSEQKRVQAQQAEQATQAAVAKLYDVPFLEQDTARWTDLINGMLEENEKKVQKEYAGDHERYARERFNLDTQNLTVKAAKNPLFKESLKRRSDFVQLMADQTKGLIDKPVTYRLTDGTVKTAPATENYRDFQAGKTLEFQYAGGYAAPTKFTKFFADNYSPNAAGDEMGKFKKFQASAQEIMGRMLTDDGMNPNDALDYMTRFGSRLGEINYKFDPRDYYKEYGIRQRDRQLGQGDRQLGIGEFNAQTGRMNAKTNQRNADTNAKKAQLAGKIAQQGFNLYNRTFEIDNVTTRDTNDVPVAVPATIYKEGKAEKNTWSLIGYDAADVLPAILKQLGVRSAVNNKTGQVNYSGGNLKDTYVKVPNSSGGFDLRKTDLTGLRYQVVGGGGLYRRLTTDSEKNPYQRATGVEKFYPELVIRITAEEALKAKSGKLFNNKWFFKDSKTGGGAYTEVEDPVTGKTYYEFPVVEGVVPSQSTKDRTEGSVQGRYMDSKAGFGSLMQSDNMSAPGPSDTGINLFNIDNDD